MCISPHALGAKPIRKIILFVVTDWETHISTSSLFSVCLKDSPGARLTSSTQLAKQHEPGRSMSGLLDLQFSSQLQLHTLKVCFVLLTFLTSNLTLNFSPTWTRFFLGVTIILNAECSFVAPTEFIVESAAKLGFALKIIPPTKTSNAIANFVFMILFHLIPASRSFQIL